MHWMSVKLPDNFQMREHSWPCRFHINNKASNAKIGQNVNKAVYFFARVNLVVCFDSILPKYTSALLFWGINPSSERHRELFVGCWSLMTSMGGNSHCICPGLNNSNTKIKSNTDKNIINRQLCCCCFPQCKNICVCFVQNGIPIFNI